MIFDNDLNDLKIFLMLIQGGREMLSNRRYFKDTIGKTKYKVTLKSVKIVKQANQVYNNITNPITFVELTQNHFPNLLFSNVVSHSFIVYFLCSNHISNIYELVSFTKDVSEGSYHIARSIRRININNILNNLFKFIRLCLLIHRVIDYAHALDNIDTNISTCTDYSVYIINILLF
jgi:hypothetical protein